MNRYFSKLAKRSGIYAEKSSQRATVDVNASGQQSMVEPVIEETVVIDQTLSGNATVKGGDVRHETQSTELNNISISKEDTSSLENVKPEVIFHEQADSITDQDSLTDTSVLTSSGDPSESKKTRESIDENQVHTKKTHNLLTSTDHIIVSVEKKILSDKDNDSPSVLNLPENKIHEQESLIDSPNKNRYAVKELNESFSSKKTEPLESVDNQINKEPLDEIMVSSSATVDRDKSINQLSASMRHSESVNESFITAPQNSRAKTQQISAPKININIGKVTIDIKQSNTKTVPPIQNNKAPLAESPVSSNRSSRLQRYYLRSL